MTAGGTSAPCSKAASECTALTLPKGWMNEQITTKTIRTNSIVRQRFLKLTPQFQFAC